MEAALQVTDLTKTYPGFKLDHVSFTLPQGAVMGLIGENGAGKSTTIKAILDLIRKDDGTVTFWGRKLSDSKQLKEDIGVVFEQGNFYETLTSTQIGSISAAAYTQWDQKVYEGYLERFQLPKDKALKTLSNGMRTKLGIAVAPLSPSQAPHPGRGYQRFGSGGTGRIFWTCSGSSSKMSTTLF